MMWHEFEELAGYEVSYEDYHDIIEPMYMALPQVTKQDFVSMINKKRFALVPYKTLVKQMRDLAETIKANCTHFTDWEHLTQLNDKVQEYIGRKYMYNTGYRIDEDSICGCYYPKRIVIYDTIRYINLEAIDL